MLKFTAELSQEFRRASSLSSLKAYHINRQAGRQNMNYSVHRQHEHYNQRTKIGHAHHHNDNKYQHQHNINTPCNRHSHNFQSPAGQHLYRTVSHSQPHHNYNNNCHPQQKHTVVNNHYATCTTPKRVRNDSHQLQCRHSHSHTRSTNIGKFHTQKPVQRSNQSKTNNVLTQANQNIIKQSDRNKQIDNKYDYSNNYSSVNLEKETARRSFNTGMERNSHQSAKLRMSSINNLQNIQRRIQATLGQQNALRI